MADVRIETLAGDAVKRALPALAELRLTVFRDWPYLYDGTLEHEREYLARFTSTPEAVIVAAFDGAKIVGVATAAPLTGHTAEFVPLFEAAGFDPSRIFYFGESVLLMSHRGRGIGHSFFDHREAAARSALTPNAAPYTHTAFCGVVRDENDPRRPGGYMPLDQFWSRRGYGKVDGLLGHYDWREIGQMQETRKAMQFWTRPL